MTDPAAYAKDYFRTIEPGNTFFNPLEIRVVRQPLWILGETHLGTACRVPALQDVLSLRTKRLFSYWQP